MQDTFWQPANIITKWSAERIIIQCQSVSKNTLLNKPTLKVSKAVVCQGGLYSLGMEKFNFVLSPASKLLKSKQPNPNLHFLYKKFRNRIVKDPKK